MAHKVLRSLLPIAVVGGAIAIAVILIRSSASAEQTTPQPTPPLVETASLSPAPAQPRLPGSGPVEPAQSLSVVPEVGGKIVFHHEALVPGGRVKSGDVLLRIEDRAFRLAVAERRSQVERAQLDLEVELGRGAVAEREWKMLGDDAPAEREALAKRKPHAAAAKAALVAAKAGLSRAQLDLERTTIRAPFDAIVMSESVEKGQVVGPGAPVATLVGTKEVWVTAAIPPESLARLRNAEMTAEVRATSAAAGAEPWAGTVAGLLPQLDAQNRMARVRIAVANPFDPEQGRTPLLPGTFADVTLIGPGVQAYAVPRRALVEGRSVWRVDGESRLRRRELAVAWSDAEHAYVTDGLEGTLTVVLSPPAVALEGMEVQTQAGLSDAAAPQGTGDHDQ